MYVKRFAKTINETRAQNAAELTTSLTGANNDLVFTAVTTGTSGNDITVEYETDGNDSNALAVAVVGNAITVTLQTDADGTASSLTTSLAGLNNDMTFTAAYTGVLGDEITIAYVDPGAEAAAEVVTVTGTDIVVTLRSVSGTLSTAAEVKSAIDGTPAAAALVTVANAGGDDGSGEVIALTETALASGADATILSTAAEVDAEIDGTAAAAALVTPANSGADTGAGAVTVMAASSLSGATDYLYDDEADYAEIEQAGGITAVQLQSNATTFSGADSIDIQHQYSYDKATWYNGTAFTQKTGATTEVKYLPAVSAAFGPFNRFRYKTLAVVPVQAALTTSLTGTNNDLTFTAVDGGIAGNEITVAYVDPGTAGASLSVDVDGNDIVFNLATSAAVASSYTTTLVGADNDIVWTAVTAGTAGDDIDIIYADPSANDAELSVDVDGTEITINLATGPAGAITSTANEVIAAVLADYQAQYLVSGALSGGDDGTGVVTALAKQDLASGDDGGAISSTGDLIKAALLADSDASALVTAADSGGDDGSGAVIAMAATNLSAGTDNIVLDMNILAL